MERVWRSVSRKFSEYLLRFRRNENEITTIQRNSGNSCNNSKWSFPTCHTRQIKGKTKTSTICRIKVKYFQIAWPTFYETYLVYYSFRYYDLIYIWRILQNKRRKRKVTLLKIDICQKCILL